MGVGNTLATVGGVVAPLLTGAIVGDRDAEDHDPDASRAEWRIVFYTGAGISVLAMFFVYFFTSVTPVIVKPKH